MIKLRCLIGNHEYYNKNLTCTLDTDRNLFVFKNQCIHCGKEFQTEMSTNEVEEPINSAIRERNKRKVVRL